MQACSREAGSPASNSRVPATRLAGGYASNLISARASAVTAATNGTAREGRAFRAANPARPARAKPPRTPPRRLPGVRSAQARVTPSASAGGIRRARQRDQHQGACPGPQQTPSWACLPLDRHQNGQRRQDRKDVRRQLVDGRGKENERAKSPARQEALGRIAPHRLRTAAEQQGSPGQQEHKEHGHEEPPGLHVLQGGIQEPVPVVAHKELLDEHASIPQIAGQVPGKADRKEGEQRTGSPQVQGPARSAGHHRQHCEERDGRRHQPLAENSQPEQCPKPGRGAPVRRLLAARPRKQAQESCGDEDCHRGVEHARVGIGHPSRRRCEDARRRVRRDVVEFPPKLPVEEAEEPQAKQRHRHPGVGLEPGGMAGRSEPEEHRRLLEPRLAPEHRRDQVARFGHLPGDRRVTGLVRANQAPVRDWQKIETDGQCSRDGGGRGAGADHWVSGVTAILRNSMAP